MNNNNIVVIQAKRPKRAKKIKQMLTKDINKNQKKEKQKKTKEYKRKETKKDAI